MSTTERKIPLKQAVEIAQRFIDLIAPCIIKCEVAGSVRRQCKEVGDIEIVCVENPENPLSTIFVEGYRGMVVNGPRLKRFKYTSIQMELYIAQPHDYGRILAIRTGSSAFSHIKLATTWNRQGWCGSENGLRRKKECEKKHNKWVIKPEYEKNPTLPPVFDTEYDFFNFLGIEWILPQNRNWVSVNEKLNYSS